MELITAQEVGKLINRHPSTIDKYVIKGLLPSYIHKDKSTKLRFWDEQEVSKALPELKAYQDLTTGQRPQKPRKPRAGIPEGYIPPLTPQQQAANNAFNLCLHS